MALLDRTALRLRLIATAGRAADALVAVLVAPRCAACDDPLDRPLAGVICERCWRSVALTTPPVCGRCGEPLAAWRLQDLHATICVRCRRRPSAIDRLRSVGPYDGVLRRAVLALKYEGRRSLAADLAALMRQQAGDLLEGGALLVPVPLHWTRAWKRGFNQAAELARHLDAPVADALVRVRRTPPQAGLSAAQRTRNVRDAFVLSRAGSRADLGHGPLVVVDDVTTTGATLEACARVLKAAGAREVRALTAARAPRPRPSQSRRPPRSGTARR